MGTTITPASADEPAIPHGTYYLSINPSQFVARNPDVDNVTNQNVSVSADSDDIFFAAAINCLPQGAVVTKCVVYGDASASAETWTLRRVNLNSETLAVMGTANINTEDSSISDATIDNSLYSYGLNISSLDTGDHLYGARITYTI